MRILLFLLPFLFAEWIHAQDTTQQIVPGRFNRPEQLDKPYIILISADGFRYDLADKYQAKNLIRLRSSGVAADDLLSVFPTLTFPNHYSMITGTYPAHHGIVDNSFLDPARHQTYTMGNRKAVEDSSWYGATPLWVLAEKQQYAQAAELLNKYLRKMPSAPDSETVREQLVNIEKSARSHTPSPAHP